MTGSAAPRAGRPVVPAERLHGTGPWLVGHTPDGRAERHARDVCGECDRRAVFTSLSCLDRITNNQYRYAKYRGLVLVIGDEDSAGADLDAMRDVVGGYRTAWSYGLADLRRGESDFVDTGVVQLLVPDALLSEPTPVAKRILNRTCAVHPLAAFQAEMIFDGYEGVVVRPVASGETLQSRPDELDDREVMQVWGQLERWGLTSFEQVRPVLRGIEQCRSIWEVEGQYPTLHRPVHGVQKNRFDFILDESPFFDGGRRTSETREAWKRDGARVLRHAMKVLKQDFPFLKRPDLYKNAQPQFRHFYFNLRLVSEYLSAVEE